MVVSQNHPFIDIDFPLSSELGVSPPQLMRINIGVWDQFPYRPVLQTGNCITLFNGGLMG